MLSRPIVSIWQKIQLTLAADYKRDLAMTITIDIEPLSDALGAAIRGIDLRQEVDERTQGRLQELFVRHCVLCFPDQ